MQENIKMSNKLVIGSEKKPDRIIPTDFSKCKKIINHKFSKLK